MRSFDKNLRHIINVAEIFYYRFTSKTVSYTHLDVYKRQEIIKCIEMDICRLKDGYDVLDKLYDCLLYTSSKIWRC